MHDVTLTHGRAIEAPFVPERALFKDAKQRAAIQMATRLGAWDELDAATDALIANMIDFCGWWRENVRGRGQSNIPDLGYFAEEAEKLTGITLKRVSRWRLTLGITEEAPDGEPELIDRYAAMVEAAARKKAGIRDADNHRAHGTGLDEWFTPGIYVDMAREVMSGIDLDPASHLIAQRRIHAERFYTAEDNGLKQEWVGRVFLNPPYSRNLIALFIEKLAAELKDARCTAAIVLTHAYTDTSWWQRLAGCAPLICFPRGRIRFVNDIGQPCNPTQGQTFAACGEGLDVAKFREVFGTIGTVR